jgi:hypothetical protein
VRHNFSYLAKSFATSETPSKHIASTTTFFVRTTSQFGIRSESLPLRLQTKYPNTIVAIGFPDFPRYRALFDERRGGLEKLGVVFITVGDNGDVQTWGL